MLRVIVHIPQKGDQTFRFTNWRTVIGRSRSCDLTLVSSQVSKSHAAIEIINGVISIRDLGSCNGIWVNGERIERQKELRANDHIILGDVQLTIDERSKIFDITPSRQVMYLIAEEQIIKGSVNENILKKSKSFIEGQPIVDFAGNPPMLRVLRITEDYIPRTAFRLTPFQLECKDERIWVWPTLEIMPAALLKLKEIKEFLYDEVEDTKPPASGKVILSRNYYALPKRLRLYNLIKMLTQREGLSMYMERSKYEPVAIEILI